MEDLLEEAEEAPTAKRKQELKDKATERRHRIENMETIKGLPFMDKVWAHNVEEALIANMGPGHEYSPRLKRYGQLENENHSISTRKSTYCDRLLGGQLVLYMTGYREYAAAYWTRRKPCLGTGKKPLSWLP